MKSTVVTDDLYSFVLSDELNSDGLRESRQLESPLAPSQPPWCIPTHSGASFRFPMSPDTQAGPVPTGAQEAQGKQASCSFPSGEQHLVVPTTVKDGRYSQKGVYKCWMWTAPSFCKPPNVCCNAFLVQRDLSGTAIVFWMKLTQLPQSC